MSVIPSTKDFGATLTKSLAPDLEAAGKTSGMSFAKGMAGGVVAVGAALIGIAIGATAMAAQMQVADAKIQGSAQITAKAATGIGDAFLATAGSSTFSGKAMAAAFGPVAGVVQTLAGHTLTAKDAMTMMAASTMLAEASGVPLANTTADLTAVLQSYGLKLKDASGASNILFNTSRLTNVGLDTLTGTVDKMHAKLGIAAPTLTDVSALMVDLANHGISGSRGLMVVNSAMSTLLGGSKATTTELKTLGINVYNSSGQFVGMGSVLAQLGPKLAGMSDKQREVALTALLGKAGAAALTSTVLAGAAGYDKATAAVTTHNAVQAAAAAMSGTLEGQWKTLTATAADLWTMLGEKLLPVVIGFMGFVTSTAIPAIKDFYSGFTVGTDALGSAQSQFAVWGAVIGGIFSQQIGPAVQKFCSAISTVLVPAIKLYGNYLADILVPVTISLATFIFGTLIPDLVTFGFWLDDNKGKLAVIAGVITAVLLPALVLMAVQATISGAETAAIWLLIQASAIASTAATVAQFVIQEAKWVLAGITAAASAAVQVGAWIATAAAAVFNAALIAGAWLIAMGPIGLVIVAVVGLGVLIATHMDLIKGWISDAWNWISSVTSTAWNWIKDNLRTILEVIVVVITGPMGIIAALIFNNWAQIKTWTSDAWNAIQTVLTVVWNWISTAVTTYFNTYKTIITDVWNAVSTVTSTVWGAIQTALSTVWNLITSVLTLAVNGWKLIISAAWTAIQTATSTVWAAIQSVLTTAWNWITATATTVFNAILSLITGAWNAVQTSTNVIWAAIRAYIQLTVTGIQTILSWFSGLGTLFQGWFQAAYTAAVGVLNNLVSWLRGLGGLILGAVGNLLGLMVQAGKDVIQGFWNGLVSVWNTVVAWFKSLGGIISAIKGPINVDASLLIPHGKAIMQGFFDGLKAGWSGVSGFLGGVAVSVSGTAGQIAGAVGTAMNLTGAPAGNSNVGIVQFMAAQLGWVGAQWDALQAVIMRESGFNNLAQNPTSTAHGIFQMLTETSNDPTIQTQHGLAYVQQRYGTPMAALAHENAFGWYDQGGMLKPGSVGANSGNLPERVLSGSQTEWFEAGRAASGAGGSSELLAELQGLRADIRSLPKQYQMGQRQMAGAR
jgi:TP901 family phage tail tape measure protein